MSRGAASRTGVAVKALLALPLLCSGGALVSDAIEAEPKPSGIYIEDTLGVDSDTLGLGIVPVVAGTLALGSAYSESRRLREQRDTIGAR